MPPPAAFPKFAELCHLEGCLGIRGAQGHGMPTAEGWFLKGSTESKEVAELTFSWGAYKAED